MLFQLAFLALFASVASAQNMSIVDIIVASEDHAILESAVVAAPGILSTLSGAGSFTVFAPTDRAFEDYFAGDFLEQLLTPEWNQHLVCLLTSHVVPGTTLSANLPTNETTVTTLSGYNVTLLLDGDEAFVDEIPVTTADLNATNGVVHVIGDVILPPCVAQSIVDVAGSIADFSTLVDLLPMRLIETLDGEGPFTVFAPTDAAFAKLPTSVLEFLSEDSDALQAVLLYHVVPGNVYASNLTLTSTYTTVEGGNLTFTATGSTVTINEGAATVALADVLAGNGVIHVIDSVLVPPDLVFPPAANGTSAPAMAPVMGVPPPMNVTNTTTMAPMMGGGKTSAPVPAEPPAVPVPAQPTAAPVLAKPTAAPVPKSKTSAPVAARPVAAVMPTKPTSGGMARPVTVAVVAVAATMGLFL